MIENQPPTDIALPLSMLRAPLEPGAVDVPAAFFSYEAAMRASRDAFEHEAGLHRLLSPAIGERRLERFLLEFCVRGVAMTEPVEGWIRRAGERCIALGFATLGRTLVAHARHEEGHDLLMRADARAIAERIAQRTGAPIDLAALLERPYSKGVVRYRLLHEDIIASDAPYGQIAIEYEIERLSLTMGARLVARCVDTFGRDILGALSFLTEHVELDVGHTRLNERALARLVAVHPGFVTPLVVAGSEALSAYAAFLRDCIDAAERGPEWAS